MSFEWWASSKYINLPMVCDYCNILARINEVELLTTTYINDMANLECLQFISGLKKHGLAKKCPNQEI